MKKDLLNLFPHYASIEDGITKEEQCVQGSDFVEGKRDLSLMNDEFTAIIFAPDPITGIPRSDLAVIMSKDTAPEISQYIQSHFQQPLNSAPGVPDGDVVLEMMKSHRETLESYSDRLRSIVQRSLSAAQKDKS